MTNNYEPVRSRAKTQNTKRDDSMVREPKKETEPALTRKGISINDIREVERVDKLVADTETFNKIADLASFGYSVAIISYMLGVDAETFETFRIENEEAVKDAIALGRVIDETEFITRLRYCAMSNQSNWLTAFQTYGKINFGWLSNNQSVKTQQELPSSITFTAIDPTKFEDDL